MFLSLDINVVVDILVHGLNKLTLVNKNWPTMNIVCWMMKIHPILVKNMWISF